MNSMNKVLKWTVHGSQNCPKILFTYFMNSARWQLNSLLRDFMKLILKTGFNLWMLEPFPSVYTYKKKGPPAPLHSKKHGFYPWVERPKVSHPPVPTSFHPPQWGDPRVRVPLGVRIAKIQGSAAFCFPGNKWSHLSNRYIHPKAPQNELLETIPGPSSPRPGDGWSAGYVLSMVGMWTSSLYQIPVPGYTRVKNKSAMCILDAGGSFMKGWSAIKPGKSSTTWRANRYVYCLQRPI